MSRHPSKSALCPSPRILISAANFIGVIMWHNDIRCRRWRQYCYLDKSRFSVLDWKKTNRILPFSGASNGASVWEPKSCLSLQMLFYQHRNSLYPERSHDRLVFVLEIFILGKSYVETGPWSDQPPPLPPPPCPKQKFQNRPLFADSGRKETPFFNWNRWFWGLIKHPIFIQNDVFSLCIVKSSFLWKREWLYLCLRFKWYTVLRTPCVIIHRIIQLNVLANRYLLHLLKRFAYLRPLPMNRSASVIDIHFVWSRMLLRSRFLFLFPNILIPVIKIKRSLARRDPYTGKTATLYM